MARFDYTARDTQGTIISETLSAGNLDDAANLLRSQRYQILKLTERKNPTILNSVGGSVSTIDKANLCRYLSTMINAGLPLSEALDTIVKDTRNPTLKKLLQDTQNRLNQGESLSDAFARYPGIFGKIFITIVRAGDQSGSLQQSFKYLEDQLLASHNLSQKVKGALIYPAVIIATMFAVGTVLIVFVIPQIAKVFLNSSLPVPAMTKTVFEFVLNFNRNLPFIGAAFGLVVVSVVIASRTNKGKEVLLSLVKQVPGVKNLFEKLDIARFARTLATLMQSGVPITESLTVATNTLTQKKFKPLTLALTEDIKKGESMASIFRRHSEHIPQMLISMISTGEKTGSLDKILFEVADFYEQELESEIKNFTAILEPVIMLIIGIGVGGMVLSVIAPVYSLVSSLQGIQ
ncbi:MAG: type II secretion system F family protein [Candidatus Chisholmbacteria bacterium]|nr:type II secretion system F family protein [Candidatus Chisholmbacteria bacterium]